MSHIRTSLPVPTQPWNAAKARFLEGLSPTEITRFEHATCENLFYNASAAQKRHAKRSHGWLVQERLSPLMNAVSDYGQALDVYANTYGLIISPLWGSLRIASEAALSDAYLDVLRFCVVTKDFFSRARKLRKHSKRVEKEAGLAHMISQGSNEKLSRQYRVLSSLPMVHYAAKHAVLRHQRYPGTGAWFQQTTQFTSWKTSPAYDCLCCYGIPGSGRSILAASVVDALLEERLHNGDEAVCCYYCDYANIASLDSLRIIWSLIKQILETLPLETFDDTFHCPYEEDRPIPAFSESSQYFVSLLVPLSKVTIMIDGIDELDHKTQILITTFITETLRSAIVIVKILVTSRPAEVLIKTSLKALRHMYLSVDSSQDDIALFIAGNLKQIVSAQNPLLKDERIARHVVTTLSDRAKGMFLWVRFLWVVFQMHEIAETLTEHAIYQLLDDLPKDLDETYSRIVNKVSRSTGGPSKIEMMKKVFIWVATARRPLPLDELQEAVALETFDKHLRVDRIAANTGARLMACRGNLVLVSTMESDVQSTHPPSFDALWADQLVGELCLTYLSFSDFEAQLAKRPTASTLSGSTAQGLIWWNVPFASHMRGLMSLSRILPARSYSSSMSTPAWALPAVNRTPSTALTNKYVLLDYVSSYWISHTSNFKSGDAARWAVFEDLALYKHLAFEFRPWLDSLHMT
ncbi:hypothetical protein EK21DRAFT_91811 [Setomelanomma holmii]|uniref:Nephrocystin 3-like N-terminal domain-containing protein n=1 Tax=Setomelanomma holmii TaxID=210430 RepID=A0A9P4H529_9PLEO|nr:hypothetical protein EK21DRAFT_91811 [Setomelanomma holmii]